jgi:hypothetical protein
MTPLRSTSPPPLRQAALIAVIGYLMSFGVPFASFSLMPRIFVPDDAARTAQECSAHPAILGAIILLFLANFVGDVVNAWGLYWLLRPVHASMSMLVASLRVVYAAMGLAAVLELVTAHRLITRPGALAALGQSGRDAQVYTALGSFNSQFAFSLVLFGAYLVLLGWLVYRAGYMPRWLGVVVAVAGAGWMVSEAGRYLLPGVDLGFLFFTSFGELALIVWLIGWGTRLREPAVA